MFGIAPGVHRARFCFSEESCISVLRSKPI
jgi:hypothetical protein